MAVWCLFALLAWLVCSQRMDVAVGGWDNRMSGRKEGARRILWSIGDGIGEKREITADALLQIWVETGSWISGVVSRYMVVVFNLFVALGGETLGSVGIDCWGWESWTKQLVRRGMPESERSMGSRGDVNRKAVQGILLQDWEWCWGTASEGKMRKHLRWTQVSDSLGLWVSRELLLKLGSGNKQ